MEEFIYKLLGQYDGFYVNPPLDKRKMYIDDKVICLNNDGFEAWIGTPNEWQTYFKNEDFRKVCFWYLRTWIFIDWFGLRSFIWYKLLHRKCERNIPRDATPIQEEKP